MLRVAIQGGGCSGFEYALGFDRGAQEGDLELELHGVTVVVDPFSAPYLKGAEIDFVDSLQEPASRSTTRTPSLVRLRPLASRWQRATRRRAPRGGCGSGCSH